MKTITFTIPVPPSLKNSVVLGRGRMRKSGACKAAMRGIRDAARLAVEARYPSTQGPLFGGNRVSLDVEHDVGRGLLNVVLTDLGPFPTRGATGRKRDLQNLQDALCDALEGIVYENDNQIDRLTMARARHAGDYVVPFGD